jgi:hypothetical protein
MVANKMLIGQIHNIIITHSPEEATSFVMSLLQNAFTAGYNASSLYIRTADEAYTHGNALKNSGYVEITGNILPKQPDTHDPEKEAKHMLRKIDEQEAERTDLLKRVNKSDQWTMQNNWPDNPTEC